MAGLTMHRRAVPAPIVLCATALRLSRTPRFSATKTSPWPAPGYGGFGARMALAFGQRPPNPSGHSAVMLFAQTHGRPLGAFAARTSQLKSPQKPSLCRQQRALTSCLLRFTTSRIPFCPLCFTAVLALPFRTKHGAKTSFLGLDTMLSSSHGSALASALARSSPWQLQKPTLSRQHKAVSSRRYRHSFASSVPLHIHFVSLAQLP